LVPAVWIAACAARGGALSADHFTDPFDREMTAFLAHKTSPEQTVSDVFDLTGFARGDALRGELMRLVAAHLTRLQKHGVVFALAHLDGASS
jgi:fructuronate reductase